MKKLVFTLILLLTFSMSQAQKWENIIGLPNREDQGGRIHEHYDGGYLISGNIHISGNKHGWVVKTDINGELLWDKQICVFPDQVTIGQIRYDQQGNVYLFGWFYTPETVHEYPLVVKLNACGEKQWCRVLAFEGNDYGFFTDAIILENGDLLGLAYFEPDDGQQHDIIFLIRITTDGEIIWKRSYASKDQHPYYAVRVGENVDKCGNHYIITGYVYSPYPNAPNPYHVWFRP